MDLPFDIQRQIALELEPYDLIMFCRSNKTINQEICNSNEFWRLKIQRDFPVIWSYFNDHNLILKNPKDTYIRNFIGISEAVENELNRFMYRYIDKIGLKNGKDPYDIGRYMDRTSKKYDPNVFYDKINRIGLNNNQDVYELKNRIYKVLYDSYSDYIKSDTRINTTKYLNDIIAKNLSKHGIIGIFSLTDYLWSIIVSSPLKKYMKYI